MNVFIGYDSKEPAAYHVAAHSILRRASKPVSITPIALDNLKGVYTRERGAKESTEFSISRFLVPYLSNYTGYSLFMDSDMLVQADICELEWEIYKDFANIHQRDRWPAEWAVKVCKHDYVPRSAVKFLGNEQTAYPRKNWSSLMLFNNTRCRALTPDYVNKATGLELHRFQWLKDAEIESLPLEWNYLVGEEKQSTNPPKIIHYTEGGPWFDDCKNVPFADLWQSERQHMLGGRP